MCKKRKQLSEQSIFDNNPFLDGFFEWMDLPEGERATEVLDTLLDLMDDVQVDVRGKRHSVGVDLQDGCAAGLVRWLDDDAPIKTAWPQ